MSPGEMAARLGAVAAIVTRYGMDAERLRRCSARSVAERDYQTAARLETQAIEREQIAAELSEILRGP